jgi:asparagine synthase (glutamine-hydrolysing)
VRPGAVFFCAEYHANGTIVCRGRPSFSAGHRVPSLDRAGGDGIFGEWQWDGERLTVRNDRYGCFPLFYWRTDRSIAISNSIAQLLDEGAPPTLDLPALAAFLRLGFFLGEDTAFEAIRSVPPDCAMTWSRGRFDQTSRYSFWHASDVSRDDALDGFNRRFRRAVERRLSTEPAYLPLSGGRDSRHILLDLCALGRPPAACVTVVPFPPRETLEVRIASRVAEAAGVPHVVVAQSSSRVAAERRKNELTHLLSDEHAHFLALADYLTGRAATAYDGLGGDMLTGQTSSLTPVLLGLIRSGHLRQAAATMFEGYEKHGIEAALRALLHRRFYEQVGPEVATERVIGELSKHLDAANPVLSFFFWSRTRRELALAPYGIMQSTVVFSPYLDHEVFDFLMSLPPETVIDHRFHTDAIARADPRFDAIAYEEGPSSHARSSAHRRTAFDAALLLLISRSPVRHSYALPRLAASALAGSPDHVWFVPLVVYLIQLAEHMRPGRAGAPPAVQDLRASA